jgi:hypothetical protein
LFCKKGSEFTCDPTFKTDLEKAENLIKDGKYKEALAVYNSLMAKDPKNPYYLYLKAKCFISWGSIQL